MILQGLTWGGLGGSGRTFIDEQANLTDYINYQLGTGSQVETFSFNTTPGQERSIIENIDAQPSSAGGFKCAEFVGEVLRKVPPFQGIKPTIFPGRLANQLRELQERLLREKARGR